MKQRSFEQRFGQEWQQFADLLTELEKHPGRNRHAAAEFADQYRRICYLLALAQDRQYSPLLVDHLNQLALRGHEILYRKPPGHVSYRILKFLAHDFPRGVRDNASLVWLASALLYLPGLLFGTLIFLRPELAYSFFSAEQIAQFVAMYEPETHQASAERRSASEDWLMFGFYIRNNIGIGFQTFASGLMAGLGTLFYLIYNGLAMGGVAGYLTQLGYSAPFYSFVIGHGAFELTAITLAGAAGLRMGGALIMPGQRSRKRALLEEARNSLTLVYGMFAMLLLAAFLEAFWSSSSSVSVAGKLGVGAILWLFVFTYFIFGGRRGSD